MPLKGLILPLDKVANADVSSLYYRLVKLVRWAR